jgi:hypothetical protein
MSESEVFNLIFLPGFSTADKVTDISGRGVGMDVVRRNIEALRGKIEIRSVAARARPSISLPLTMAIIDGMIVRVGSQRYVVPTLSIEQSFRPQPEHDPHRGRPGRDGDGPRLAAADLPAQPDLRPERGRPERHRRASCSSSRPTGPAAAC